MLLKPWRAGRVTNLARLLFEQTRAAEFSEGDGRANLLQLARVLICEEGIV